MNITTLYQLCDAIQTAVETAVAGDAGDWTVTVNSDPQAAAASLPVGNVLQLVITPIAHKSDRGDEEDSLPRDGAKSVLSVDFRLRSRMGSTDSEPLRRAKALKWDLVSGVLTRRAGFEIPSGPRATWKEGVAVNDPFVERKDRCVAIVCSAVYERFWRTT